MIFDNFLSRLKNISIDEAEEGMAAAGKKKDAALSPTLQVSVGGVGGVVWSCDDSSLPCCLIGECGDLYDPLSLVDLTFLTSFPSYPLSFPPS